MPNNPEKLRELCFHLVQCGVQGHIVSCAFAGNDGMMLSSARKNVGGGSARFEACPRGLGGRMCILKDAMNEMEAWSTRWMRASAQHAGRDGSCAKLSQRAEGKAQHAAGCAHIMRLKNLEG